MRRKCLDCNQFVEAKKKSFSTIVIIVWAVVMIIEVLFLLISISNLRRGSSPEVMFVPLLITIIIPLFIYWGRSKEERCPICKGKNFSKKET